MSKRENKSLKSTSSKTKSRINKSKSKTSTIGTLSKSRTRRVDTILLPSVRMGIQGKDYEITKLEKQYASQNIYRIKYDNCVNYVDEQFKYIVYKNMDKSFILINMTNESVTDIIKQKIESALLKKGNTNLNKSILSNPRTLLLQSCVSDIDLEPAQRELDKLNDKLRRKCPSLFFRLAPFYDFLQHIPIYSEHGHISLGSNFYSMLVLALCKTGEQVKCMSTIEIKISNDGEVVINSKTDPAEEGKKYNKILRSVLMIISEKIPNARYIKSVAINPISAWLMLNYSNAKIEDGNEFAAFINNRTITKELISEYYSLPTNRLRFIVPLGHDTSENSHKEFNQLVEAGTSVENEITSLKNSIRCAN